MVDATKPDQAQRWQARLAAADPSLRVHLIGVGGAGLSAIARVLLELGVRVSGSDRQSNEAAHDLERAGATIFDAQRAENLAGMGPDERPDVVLISSAVDGRNPERQAAEALGMPVVKRDGFLPALLAQRTVVAIAGTHGKTTTTAMTATVLRDAGIDCGYIIGAPVHGLGSGHAGTSPLFVIEADEYDHMFLGLRPAVAVITNVEWDHPDCYPTPASFRRAFMQFVDLVPREGMIISSADDEGARQVRAYSASRGPNWITFGLREGADLRAVNLEAVPGSGYRADVLWWNAPAGSLALEAPGAHNVQNALAALAVASWCKVPTGPALLALHGYRGAARRFEFKGEAAGVSVFDDYAHHPTEIEATLAAARRRYPKRTIWAVFQPHTFSRTRHMLYRMGDSFEQADHVIVTDIYAAREVDDGSVSATELVATSSHPSIAHVGALREVAAHLAGRVQPGDVVLTLGAGDSYRIGEMLLEALRAREKGGRP